MVYLNKHEKASSKDILSLLKLDWTDNRMEKHLETIKEVEKIKIKNRIYYQLKEKVSNDLFSNFQ